MITQNPYTEPRESWEALCKWILEKVKAPDGEPISEGVTKVLAIGAAIGARFALLSPPFALGLAAYSNQQDGPMWASIQKAFIEDYGRSVMQHTDALWFNLGFTNTRHDFQVIDDSAEVPSPLTEEDAQQILDDLDGLFGGGEAA